MTYIAPQKNVCSLWNYFAYLQMGHAENGGSPIPDQVPFSINFL